MILRCSYHDAKYKRSRIQALISRRTIAIGRAPLTNGQKQKGVVIN